MVNCLPKVQHKKWMGLGGGTRTHAHRCHLKTTDDRSTAETYSPHKMYRMGPVPRHCGGEGRTRTCDVQAAPAALPSELPPRNDACPECTTRLSGLVLDLLVYSHAGYRWACSRLRCPTVISTEWVSAASPDFLAGTVGIEPTHHGIKTRCLNRLAMPHQTMFAALSPGLEPGR